MASAASPAWRWAKAQPTCRWCRPLTASGGNWKRAAARPSTRPGVAWCRPTGCCWRWARGCRRFWPRRWVRRPRCRCTARSCSGMTCRPWPQRGRPAHCRFSSGCPAPVTKTAATAFPPPAAARPGSSWPVRSTVTPPRPRPSTAPWRPARRPTSPPAACKGGWRCRHPSVWMRGPASAAKAAIAARRCCNLHTRRRRWLHTHQVRVQFR